MKQHKRRPFASANERPLNLGLQKRLKEISLSCLRQNNFTPMWQKVSRGLLNAPDYLTVSHPSIGGKIAPQVSRCLSCLGVELIGVEPDDLWVLVSLRTTS